MSRSGGHIAGIYKGVIKVDMWVVPQVRVWGLGFRVGHMSYSLNSLKAVI